MVGRQQRKRSRRIQKKKPDHSILSDKRISRIMKSVKQLKRAKLTPALRKVAKKRQKKLRLLINPRTSMSKRRALLIQRGKG